MSVYSPRITTDRQPDYSDLGRFVNFAAWRCLAPAEKAVAIWRYITDRETGFFPVQGIYEDADPGPEYAFFDERDVSKVLNVHGHGYCGLLSPTLDGIFTHAGFTDSRIIRMKENHHCVTEVFYDGGWHYFDVDLRGLLMKEDGSVASLEEACSDQDLWIKPSIEIEPFYPLDDKKAMFEGYSQCRLERLFSWHKNGHTMDFVLRPGESLTRYWDPQGRWFHPWPAAGGFNMDFLRRRFEADPRGLKCKHPGWTRWTHGNGLLVYAPKLREGFSDLAQGAEEFEGVALTSRGAVSDGGGYLTFGVSTPYIIVGEVAQIGPPARVQGAAILSYRSLGDTTASVSTDEGHTWQTVGGTEDSAAVTIDLTSHVVGRYGYQIRFDLPAGSGLDEFVLETWSQLSPPSLPRLHAGRNALHFETGDRYGYHTSVKEIRLNLRDPAQLERYLVRLDGDYQPLRVEAKIRGEAVLRIDARPDGGIQWLTAGGYFHTRLGERAGENGNAIYYSVNGADGPWHDVCQARVPDWVEFWHTGMDGDVVLDTPIETIHLKYVGDPGLNQIWIYAHCLESAPPSPLRVTHGYEIDGELREEEHLVDRAAEYEMVCESEPENRYLRFAVDSCRTPSRGR
ncbi:MAG TPA: hypothetical protein QGF95_08855 [Candidatus Latescibacteria bacterium]|nr:hypothetical protein [Gemmatimonadaceae bacterium]MDP6018357.1 hypothetical protein [Candidatus Latescibacterota bacterium]HJP30650.1 hypothetical protein [Candidatus Latescibacterota bacterium]